MLFVSILALLQSIQISAVAAYYSIIGLTAIFPTFVFAVIIMGIVLEVGKIVQAIWLHVFWKEAGILLRTYLTIALLVLMSITSIGIFGFLQRQHIEQSASSANSEILIDTIQLQITRQEKIIQDSTTVINQLDQAVNVLTEAQRIRGPEGQIAVRDSQKEEREILNNAIDEANDRIFELNTEKSKLLTEQAKLEAEVGPIRYVAEMFYGPDPSKNVLEEAVRWLIIIIVIVFDPLAVALIIASIKGFEIYKSKRKIKLSATPENNTKIEESTLIVEPTVPEISEEDREKKTRIMKDSGWLSS